MTRMLAVHDLLRGLLPPAVMVRVSDGTEVSEPLYAAEEVAIANAVERRRREFAAGRACARAALSDLGLAVGAIPVRPDRSPEWPAGIVASITHCPGLIAAAAAWQRELNGLGLDAEARERPLDDSLDRFIRTPVEREAMAALSIPPELDIVRLAFSAKESVHKCIAPVSGITLGFHDVELDLDVQSGAFRPRLVTQREGLPDFNHLRGRFAVTNEFVLTAVYFPAEALDSGENEA